ncbi:MAG: hypothetical protein ACRD21_01080 [Vicinamibacteria bacterium]
MLDRLRKRFESLLSRTAPATAEPGAAAAAVEAAIEESKGANDVEAILLARREAQKRESRLILTERIHNRAASLLNELRTDLLHDIHRSLEEEVRNQSLHDLLQVTLDSGFTARLDAAIDEHVERLLQTLETEFRDQADAAAQLLPRKDRFTTELRLYRDSVLKKHLLEQVEVLALPTSAQAFPENRGNAEELKERITQYWAACRDALDKFFRSVEMVLLDSAREGIRIESSVIRDRLLAAQYRNGYRLLEDRFRALYAEIAALHMSVEPVDKKKAALDRRVVDEIIVPLAYFIRERSEPEPREALASRGELFSDIVDKLVAVPDPFLQTAEAIKPVLRKSVEQARPIASQDSPYLRAAIESLNPSAIHRTTALLKVLETLVHSEIDEWALLGVEQVIRLNRAQYRLYQQLDRSHRDLVRKLVPLDRVWDEDAELVAEIIEQTEPPRELVEDLFLALGYLDWPEPLPDDSRALLRYVAVYALFAPELAAWPSLYLADAPSAVERARLARTLVERLGPSAVGADERQKRVGAAPHPVDLSKALAAMGYLPEDEERLTRFREEIRTAVEQGDAATLGRALLHLRKLRESVVKERAALGATQMDADPYLVELWPTPESALVGLVLFRGPGLGIAPVERLTRDSGTGNRKETEDKLRRQLQSQALIYQTFWKLFSRRSLLSMEHRRGLPSFVKTLYEPTEPNRLLLLARLRYAKELVALMEAFARQIGQFEPQATAEVNGVLQILTGLVRKVDELIRTTDKSREPAELVRLVKEYDRALKYLNTVVVHSVNPWLQRQTSDLGTEFEFKKKEVESAVRRHTSRQGLNWAEDVEGFEAHAIRGTLGCRALLKLADGASKVILLDYDRRRQDWQVRHMGPRLTDVVRDALRQRGKSLPDDYDEKFEQPTFRLDEQSCRFLWVKRAVARVEATLVLDGARGENPWRVVYLKYNSEVLVDRLR